MKAGFAMEPSYEPDYMEKRINEFKDDPENMKVVQNFVDDVLRVAQIESEQKLKSQQGRGKSSRENSVLSNFRNGRMVNRARGVVTRLFDIICNCANSATVPAQRLSTKRSSKN